MNNISARECAYITLLKCEKDKSYSNIEQNVQIKKHSLDGIERALFVATVRGTIERKITLDYYLSSVSSRPLCELDIRLLTILRIGAYQILFFDKIPNHAAVNESVILAKKYVKSGSDKLVNAVLRELIRRKESDSLPLPESEPERKSIKYSVPVSLITMWQEQYGDEQTTKILKSLSHPHGMTLHTNTLKITRSDLICALKEIEIEASESDEAPDAIRLPLKTPFESISHLADDGLFFVQDIASQIAAEMLGAKENECVIDCCCCPGGKSFAMALSMGNKGEIHAYDLHKNKFSLVSDTAEKLGIDIISLEERDARNPDADLFGKADAVLCDVPCSGLGIISKKPEIRFRDVAELSRFSELGLEILTASSQYCKDGGRLLFSTCTLNKDENDRVVEKFLSDNPDFTLIEIKTIFPTDDRDGFFAALMKKER